MKTYLKVFLVSGSIFGALGCEQKEDKPNELPTASIQMIAFAENAIAGTQIGTITANDPDGEIQTILSLDSRVEVSNGNILLTGDAEFNYEDPTDDELIFEVIDDDGDKITLNAFVHEIDVDEETEVIVEVEDYTTQTIFDENTPFKVGDVRLKKVYADEDLKEEEFLSEEVVEILATGYAQWVIESGEEYDRINATATAQLERTIDGIMRFHPSGVFANEIRFPASSDNLLLLIIPDPDDKLYANAGADDFNVANDISLGKILRVIEGEFIDLWNNREVDIDRTWYNATNLFYEEESANLTHLISDNLKEVSEIEIKDDRLVAYKCIGPYIRPKVKSLINDN